MHKKEYDLWRKKFLRGLLFTYIKMSVFLIDRHWKYKYLTCQKTAIKSVIKVLDNWFVRIDYAS